MTAQTPALSVAAIDAALAAATPGLDEGGRRLAAAVLRLLAAGEPVGVPAAAAAAGMPASPTGAAAAIVARRVLGRPRPGDRVLGPGPGAHAAPHPPRRNRSACLVRV